MKTVILLFIITLAGCSIVWTQTIAFKNVNIIPMDKVQSLSNQTVLIKNGVIVEIGTEVKIPKNAVKIDGGGKYLIPGLWDMHVHLADVGEEAIPIFAAYGITSVRDMGGDIPKLKNWRSQIESGILTGPRIKLCGPMLEGATAALVPGRTDHWLVENPDQAREIVKKLANEKVDCIKMRSYANPETYSALAAAAKEHNLPLGGHAPWGVDPIQSSNAGQQTYEHGWYPDSWQNLSQEKKAEIENTFQKNGSFIVPTLVAWEQRRVPFDTINIVVNDLEGKSDPRLKFVSLSLRKNWMSDLRDLRGMNTGSPGWNRALNGHFEQIAEMHEHGVGIMAGSDTGATMVYPGSALHQELKLLVEKCRLTPLEALLSATLTPAKFFKLEDKLGTIEKGKVADLILLSADPLQDISNTQKIDGVMLNGKWLDRAALDKITTGVEKKIANSQGK